MTDDAPASPSSPWSSSSCSPRPPPRAAACAATAQPSLCERRFDHVVLPAAHNAMSSQHAGFQIPNQVLTSPSSSSSGSAAS